MTTTEAIVFEMLKKGGGTFKNGKPIQYRYGYQVALKQDMPHFFTVHQIKDIADLIDSEYFADCGIWLNNKSGLIEVDIVTVHITHLRNALNIGFANDQLAIYDWNKMDTIDL